MKCRVDSFYDRMKKANVGADVLNFIALFTTGKHLIRADAYHDVVDALFEAGEQETIPEDVQKECIDVGLLILSVFEPAPPTEITKETEETAEE